MKITAGTIARTIILALAIVNRILVASGLLLKVMSLCGS